MQKTDTKYITHKILESPQKFIEFVIRSNLFAYPKRLRIHNQSNNTLKLHSDLDALILSKKSLLSQNGMQLNKKCLKFIARYSPNPFLSAFEDLDTFSCIFCPQNGQKLKNPQKCVVFSCSFFAHFVPKSNILLLIIQKPSISIFRCHAIKCPCPQKLV